MEIIKGPRTNKQWTMTLFQTKTTDRKSRRGNNYHKAENQSTNSSWPQWENKSLHLRIFTSSHTCKHETFPVVCNGLHLSPPPPIHFLHDFERYVAHLYQMDRKDYGQERRWRLQFLLVQWLVTFFSPQIICMQLNLAVTDAISSVIDRFILLPI